MASERTSSIMQGRDASTRGSENDSAEGTMLSAWEKINAGELEAASMLFKLAVQQAEMEFGQKSIELSNIYTNASTGLFLASPGNYEEAVRLLQLAVDLQTAKSGEVSPECGRVHRQLSSMHKICNNYPMALKSMRKAIDIFEALGAFGSAQDPAEVAQMYKDLREITYLKDKSEQVEGEDPRQNAAQMMQIHDVISSDDDENYYPPDEND